MTRPRRPASAALWEFAADANGIDVTTSWSPLAVLSPAAAVTSDRTWAWLIFLALDELSRTATDVRSTWPGACFTVWVTWPTALVIWELVVV